MTMFERALKWAGSKKELAERLGVSPSNVSHWAKNGVPPKHTIEIERLTRGRLRAKDW